MQREMPWLFSMLFDLACTLENVISTGSSLTVYSRRQKSEKCQCWLRSQGFATAPNLERCVSQRCFCLKFNDEVSKLTKK
jgi:hypothetical protein